MSISLSTLAPDVSRIYLSDVADDNQVVKIPGAQSTTIQSPLLDGSNLKLKMDPCSPCKKVEINNCSPYKKVEFKKECDPCKKIENDPCKKIENDPCKKIENDPCKKIENDPCGKNKMLGSNWTWIGALILWFIVFTVLFWLIYYSLKPSFVLQSDSNQIDTAKVLLAAVISALILIIIVWIIKFAINRK